MLDEHTVTGGSRRCDLSSAASSPWTATARRSGQSSRQRGASHDDQRLVADRWSPAHHRVKTELAGPHVRLSITDNGPGISTENLAKIFEPLFTTKVSGVGLGLPTVRTIVEQHGGTIDVESAVDAGTTFVVWLPRQSGDAALPDDKEKEQAA
jgi:signal transduction histidine kinase